LVTVLGRPVVPLPMDLATDGLCDRLSGGTTVEAIDIERLAASLICVDAILVVRVIDPAAACMSTGYPLGLCTIS
jgi:hypothetical protein